VNKMTDLTFYCDPPAFGLPSWSWKTLKTLLYAHWAGISLDKQLTSYPYSPLGSSPVLIWNQLAIPAERQLQWLRKVRSRASAFRNACLANETQNVCDIDDTRTVIERADITAFVAFVEHRLAPVVVRSLLIARMRLDGTIGRPILAHRRERAVHFLFLRQVYMSPHCSMKHCGVLLRDVPAPVRQVLIRKARQQARCQLSKLGISSMEQVRSLHLR